MEREEQEGRMDGNRMRQRWERGVWEKRGREALEYARSQEKGYRK